jgi:hypothetical protein
VRGLTAVLVFAFFITSGCGAVARGPGDVSAPRTSSPQTTPSAGPACGPASLPVARANASLAYIPGIGQAVLFGGRSSGGFLGDTWTWKAGCWTQSTSTGPSPRMGMAMAYDPARKIVIAFGGRTDTAKQIFSPETWAWNGVSWSLLSSGGPALELGWEAFDPSSGRVLLYSSINGVPSTLTWDGVKWNALSGQSPPARQAASMASDPVTGEPILFGGLSLNPPAYLNDTWAWNGLSWTHLMPVHSPPARSAAAMATSSVNHRVVLVGGRVGSTYLTDSWTWDGTDWTITAGFGGRIDAVAVDVGTTVLLFGGVNTAANSLTNDSAVWDGSSWAAA